MTCKHCGEQVGKNTVRRSPEPFVYYPYVHSPAHLIHCWDNESKKLRETVAEPLEMN